MELAPRPEYGLIKPLIRREEAARGRSAPAGSRCAPPCRSSSPTRRCARRFTVRAGERLGFSLRWASPEDRDAPEPTPAERVAARIDDTVEAWRSWEAEHDVYRASTTSSCGTARAC